MREFAKGYIRVMRVVGLAIIVLIFLLIYNMWIKNYEAYNREQLAASVGIPGDHYVLMYDQKRIKLHLAASLDSNSKGTVILEGPERISWGSELIKFEFIREGTGYKPISDEFFLRKEMYVPRSDIQAQELAKSVKKALRKHWWVT